VGRSAGDACCSDGILTSLTLPVPPHSSNTGWLPVIAILADELAVWSGGGLRTGDPGQRG
jgi:hypothetical protein